MAVHDGHRDRMRKKIEQFGMESLLDHEVLEFLLYAVVPRKDTNELAHNILNEFGSLTSVFDQSVERLQKVKGVTYNMAVFLSSLSDVSRRYYSKRVENVYISNISDCVELMRPIIASLPKEEIYILLGDSEGKLIKKTRVGMGVVNESFCNVRDIVDIVLKNEASSVVLVHNHPSNNPTPSQADSGITERIFYALTNIGVRFADHVIITKDSYFSFRQHGIFSQLANSHVTFKNGGISEIIYPPSNADAFEEEKSFSSSSAKNKKRVGKNKIDKITPDF